MKGREEAIAEESSRVAKSREKLRIRVEKREKALKDLSKEEKAQEIRRKIGNTQQHRVVVSEKMSLFDENKNSAKESARVKRIAKSLGKQ